MTITFNTNVAALTSQRYLQKASSATASSLAKLSSGSRVPTAKDDAAGLAVGSRLKAEVAGLKTAASNANQAVSLLQIADGALSTAGDVLVRMKTLAVQSSSGQLSDNERSLLNQEFTNLRSEIDRIANVTNFNGKTLLDGGDVSMKSNEGHAGMLSAKGMTVRFNTDITNDGDAYRISYDYTDNTTDDNATSEKDTGKLTVTNLTTGNSQTIDISAAIRAKTGELADADADGVHSDTTLSTNLKGGDAAEINFSAIGVTVVLDSNFSVTTDLNTTFTYDASSTSSAATKFGNFVFNTSGTAGLTYSSIGGDPTGAAVANSLRASSAFDATTGKLTITANQTEVGAGASDDTIALSANGLEFQVDDGAWASTATLTATAAASLSNINVRLATGNQKLFSFTVDKNFDALVTASNATANMVVDVGSYVFGGHEVAGIDRSFDFKVGTGTSANDSISFTLSAATTSALGISSSSVDTVGNATSAINSLNSAISTVASRRADIGANQSRLEFAASSIAVAIDNTTAAQSGLLDVDVSSEMTAFSSQQVLLQAGVSLLAQANQQPSLLLRLLQ